MLQIYVHVLEIKIIVRGGKFMVHGPGEVVIAATGGVHGCFDKIE